MSATFKSLGRTWLWCAYAIVTWLAAVWSIGAICRVTILLWHAGWSAVK